MTITTVYWTSSDLSLVSVLSLFFPIEKIDKTNPRKAEFVFVRTSELDGLITRYWEREILVEPRQYFDNLKSLKARLYANE
ncbi:MAG TPA: DUF5659 domain-containing protein [Candidatus Saccharimonadales bacterium]|nr:DUF5659 domain-containing protein [Candidatus Saccharimonadales bacterium]